MSSKLSYDMSFDWDDDVVEQIARGKLPDFAKDGSNSVPGAKPVSAAPCLATRSVSPTAALVPTKPSSSTSSSRSSTTSSPRTVSRPLCVADLERRFGKAQSPDDKKTKLDEPLRMTENAVIQSTTTAQNPPAQLEEDHTSSDDDVYETASEGHTTSEEATTPEQETAMAEDMTTSKETEASNASAELTSSGQQKTTPEMMATSEEANEDPNLTNTSGHPPVLGRYRKHSPKKKKDRKPKAEEST